ncbi:MULTISPECIES: DUF1007 family protein [unclassified Mesorhizobium]|uniref:DUF1007 family protein n=1 Tax=unclassified Mesorhizobium TaxID=325217 RepID=UPI00112B0236|nr:MULTISPECIES: DUF1007 family protein [unclassified Mesorhizobium]MBZ9811862.1 DUF1007 family protein [Mesorhizobium sp. ESP-6-2]TPM24758.1 DUF1007 family protein [Mesorhizobium sp. B2-2-2]
MDWTFDDGFSADAIQGLDEDVGGAPVRGELQPLAHVNVESLHMFEFLTCLGLTEVDEVYGVQAGSRKRALWFSSVIERYFREGPGVGLGWVCR